jgi:membrane-associated phospholipid phosphatase
MGTRNRNIKWFAVLSSIFAFTGIMGFARIYQGLHTVDQVLYGWCLGFWFALFFHFCIREWLIDHVDNRIGEMSRNYKTWVNLSVIVMLFLAG